MKQAKIHVPRHLSLECPNLPIIGHVRNARSRALHDANASALAHSRGHMSLKELQGPLPGVERVKG